MQQTTYNYEIISNPFSRSHMVAMVAVTRGNNMASLIPLEKKVPKFSFRLT